MVVVVWSSVLPLILLTSLIIYDEWASTPSCKFVTQPDHNELGPGPYSGSDDLKVMVVANLLLLGSDSGFINRYFRDYYMAKFFRKSFHALNPDMLLVLGDVSAKGSELARTDWLTVLDQFHQVLGPFLGIPYHVTLGDRDLGECSGLDARSVDWIAGNFPGLDSSGCDAFEISNTSFVSLNTVSLLCGNNKLRFSVEKVIETESVDHRKEAEGTATVVGDSGKSNEMYHNFAWRENSAMSRSGPVLLLHFPLYQTGETKCPSQNSNTHGNRMFAAPGPYGLMHYVPLNATEYIFQALKPRIVFSAHSHEFCDYTHSDGTREVSVSAMTWKARDDPGFVVANFHANGRGVDISYCSLATESHLLIAFFLVSISLVFIILVPIVTPWRC